MPVDRLVLQAMELEGLLCFRCPLLREVEEEFGEVCGVSVRDLAPVVDDSRSGIRVAVSGRQIVGYAIFGRPGLFPGLAELPLEVADDALLIAALYVTREAEEQNVDADLLVAVMDFAREQGYQRVQAVCREEQDEELSVRVGLVAEAGFELSMTESGLCLAETTLERLDGQETETRASGPGFIEGWPVPGIDTGRSRPGFLEL